MVKFVSVDEDFVSRMTSMGEKNEPSIAVRKILQRLVCSIRNKLNSKLM